MKCNHLTETEVVATYLLKSKIVAELQAEDTKIILLKCKNCNPIDFLVQMPRIGCGLAGGKWESIEPLIREDHAPGELKQ